MPTGPNRTTKIVDCARGAVSTALLVALCFFAPLRASPAVAVPDEAWADTLRLEAQTAAPLRVEFEQRARTLTEAGWNPFFAFPQIDIRDGYVTSLDWATRSWRKAELAGYLAGEPRWTPVFALSTLNAGGNSNFGPRPWNNLNCLDGAAFRCLIAISESGFDKIRWLEVDGNSQSVPGDAFDLPAARSSVAWLARDEVLAASDFRDGRTSATGHPLSVRLWRRGQPIEAAPIIFQADADADMVAVDSYQSGNGRIGIVQVYQGVRPTKLFVVGDDRRAQGLGLPPGSSAHGVVRGQLIVSLVEDWVNGGDSWPAGSLVSFDLARLAQGQIQPETLFRSGGGRSLEISGTSTTVLASGDAVYLAILEGGTRTLHRANLAGSNWAIEPVMADRSKVARLVAADPAGGVVLASVESMVEPPSLYRVEGNRPVLLRQSPAFFEAGGFTIRRYTARAGDGARIPYWVVRRAGTRRPVPAILHGYGASNVPLLPGYAADVGRLLLERGGAYAIAQVRGGGEFGPQWSRAGQGSNRGRSVTDFVAVAEDMIARRITEARSLGIDGQSDGGRLVAAAAMLRPDLFAAAVSRDGAVFPEALAGVGGSPIFAEDMRLLESEEGRAIADSYWPSRMFDRSRACPNLLLTSWRGDQRVPALQSRALAGMLRAGGCDVLLYEQAGGGHSTLSPEMLGMVYGFFAQRLGLGPPAAPRVAAADPTATIYRNAMVWSDGRFEAREFAIRDGRVIPVETVGRGAAEIDLAGGFVVPPYANAHSHITHANLRTSWNYLKDGVYYVWNPNTVVLGEDSLAFYRRADTFDVAIAQGGLTEPGGHPERIYVDALREVYPGMTLRHHIGNSFHYGRNHAEIDQALDRLVSQRADFVKAYLLHSEEYLRRRDDPATYGYKGLNPGNASYLVAAAQRRGLRVAFHLETVTDLRTAAASGAAMAAHLPGHGTVTSVDELRVRTLSPADAQAVANSGMVVVPTYGTTPANYAELDRQGRGRGEALRNSHFAVQARNLRLLRAAGARILTGTDARFHIFDEIEHLVRIGGLTTGEALEAVFQTGRHLFPTRRIGCLDPGCEADFLVLSANPVSNIEALRAIRMRVKGGRELTAPPTEGPEAGGH